MANSDTVETAEQCAKNAGAIVLCEICQGNYIVSGDSGARSMAYAYATQEWKAGSRGFRGMDRKEVMRSVQDVLEDADTNCPSCGW
jgi:hypothetical protein